MKKMFIKKIEVDIDEETGEVEDITFYFDQSGSEPFSISEYIVGSPTHLALIAIDEAIEAYNKIIAKESK